MSYIPPAAQPKESTVNSTYIALNAGQTFTGEWEECLAWSDISMAIKTDQNATYTIQFSPDGNDATADSVLTRYYRVGQIEPPDVFEVTRKFYKVTFQNTSDSNQTYLRFQVLLSDRGQLNIPIDAVMSQDYSSSATRPTKYEYEVALGRRQGSTTWNKFGYNTDVDTAAPEVIAVFGGAFTPLTSASTLTVVSSSASDTNVGVGARSITVVGVNANYEYQTENIAMDGTTPVVSVNSWLGVNRVSVNLAGSTQNNVGLITLTATTGGATQATIPAGEGITQQAIYFVEKSHKFLTDFLKINIEKLAGGTTPKVRVKGWVFNVNANSKYLIYNELFDTTIHADTIILPSQPFVVDEKSCLWFEATTDQNDTFVSCRFSGILFRNVNA